MMILREIVDYGETSDEEAEGYASAEALAQDQPPERSLVVEGRWLWSPKKQRLNDWLDEQTDVFALPTGGRAWVAKNHPFISSIIELSNDESIYVRSMVAKNASTPPSVLTSLANDEMVNVRLGVASNERTPVNTLKSLAKDASWRVQFLVAKNVKTPPETLAYLANGTHSRVREGAKINPNYDPSLPATRKP